MVLHTFPKSKLSMHISYNDTRNFQMKRYFGGQVVGGFNVDCIGLVLFHQFFTNDMNVRKKNGECGVRIFVGIESDIIFQVCKNNHWRSVEAKMFITMRCRRKQTSTSRNCSQS